VAFFITGFAGHDYPLPAIQAAEALVREAGYGSAGEPWLPVGAAIHVGIASAGNVETGEGIDFTALGPMVDTARALREHAAAGEVVITEDIHDRLMSGYPDSEGYPTFDRRVARFGAGRRTVPLRVMRLAGSGLAS
jgi:class 3 adenylate cyclase